MPKSRRKPRLKVGLPVLVAGLVLITIAYVSVSGSLQNGRPPPCFPDTCPSLGYYAILGLAGFFVVMWGGIETAFAVLIRPGYLEYQSDPLAPPQPGSGPEDENILAIARELQRRLRRPRTREITGIAWSETQSWYTMGWKPWYTIGPKRRNLGKPLVMLLPAGLRGSLDPEEWKTLLAYYFLALKLPLRGFLVYVGVMLAVIFLPVLVAEVVSMWFGLGLTFAGRVIGGPIALVGFVLLFPTAKWLLLRNDRWIARQVGPRPLLDVFKKIDSLQLPRVENAKKGHGWTKRLWPMPNVTERIQNLTDK